MCGIVGVAGNVSAKAEEAFKQLLMLDTQRGPHSTGIMSVGGSFQEYQAKYIKNVGTPWDLFKDQDVVALMRRKHTALVGHNRWATKGAINANNAHPFLHGKIMGVHNGTLRNQGLLNKSSQFEVDSENIIYNIDKEGIEETTKKLDGAFALVWFDSNDNTINLLRNHERPLYLTRAKHMNTLFWASEMWMLTVACMKACIEIEEPKLIDTLKLYSYTVGDTGVVNGASHGQVLKPFVYAPRVVNNVVPIGNNTTEPKSILEVTKSKKTMVVFEVGGERRSHNNTDYHYTYGSIVEGPYAGEQVRIFAVGKSPQNKAKRSELYYGTCYFKGEVLYSYYDKSTRCVVNNLMVSSVEALPEEYEPVVDTPEDEVIIINGVVFEPAEALARVSCGCSWCAYKPKLDEINDCSFSKDSLDFLCPDCASDETIACYISEVSNG